MNQAFITQALGAPPPEKPDPLVVIKSEPPESEIVESTMGNILNKLDTKDIDIVPHTLPAGSIKCETVLLETDFIKTKNDFIVKIENENLILDTDFVKTENDPNVKTENEILIKTEDTSDDNGQEVVGVQGSKEHLGASDIFEKKMEVIKAPVIPVEPHEYTSLAKDQHACNHCQQVFNKLANLKLHIKRIHRKVTTIYKCPYCPYISNRNIRDHIIVKHKGAKDIRWFQCHLCELKFKLKYHLSRHMNVHLKHAQMQDGLGFNEKRYRCDQCDYKTDKLYMLKRHQLTHTKPEDTRYFYCHHCSYKSKRKDELKHHILKHFRNEEVQLHCYICDFMTPQRDKIFEHFKTHSKHHSELNETEYEYQLETLKKRDKRYQCDKCDYKANRSRYLNNHKIIHLKPEESQYFHCHHCSYKSIRKVTLISHISKHFKNEGVPFHCYICDFVTPKRELIVEHLKEHSEHHSECDETMYKFLLQSSIKKRKTRYSCDKCNYKTYEPQNLKRHNLIHLKPEETEYFYCYHCCFKSKYKHYLKYHIVNHFRKGDVPFHCYVCDFATPKRDLIVEHLRKHSKQHIKCEEATF